MAWDSGNYWLTRLVFQRGLGVCCLIAFLCALNQFRPLLGEHGLLPVPQYIREVSFGESPFATAAWLGIALSVLVIAGVRINAPVWAGIWILYLSFVNVGQTFYIFLGARTVETQPMPNPLSWYFQMTPEWTHKAGVLFNHFSELIVPFCYFLPQPVASIAALLTILFQATIFASGSLSWLNFLTMILAIPAIDSKWLSAILPIREPALSAPSLVFRSLVVSLGLLIPFLSIQPVRNMLSPGQVMNMSYNPWHLAGTYGAFGSITRQRFEVVAEGTDDAVVTSATQWKVTRMPPQIAPYHVRLDWLMWFAAMSSDEEHPWFVNFLARRGQWWVRTRAGLYLPPVSLDNPQFHRLLEQQGWL